MRAKLWIALGCLLVPLVTRAADSPAAPDGRQQAIDREYAELGLKEAKQKANYRQEQRAYSLQERRLEVARQELGLQRIRQQMQRPPPAPVPAPVPAHMQRPHGCNVRGGWGLIMGVCLLTHLLLTIWAFQDVRRRSNTSGLWIPVVLLTGLLGALVYAVARLGDIRQQPVA